MTISLDGERLTIEQVVAVARGREAVELTPGARAKVEGARTLVERFASGDGPVYGLTTGLGQRATMPIAPAEREAFQRRVLLGRAVAIGDPLPTEAVRAALVVRASCMAAGGSGVSPAVLDAIVTLLARGIHPVVPADASIGAADLGLLATAFLPLLGLGEAEVDGVRMPGADALAAAGLAPVTLSGRDGLALCSSNAVSAGVAALAVFDALRLFETACAAAALSLEAFVANLSPFDHRAARARPAAGQVDVARRIRALLAGSRLFEPGVARRVQDPLSFRCIPAVYGAGLAALERAREAVEVELAAPADNPLVLAGDGEMLSNGNFDTVALALACEGACLALAHVGWLAGQRVIRLLEARKTDLADSLSPLGGLQIGVAGLGLPLMQLHAELRHLALPAALDSPPVADGVEDHASHALLAVRKLERVVDRLSRIVAIELTVAAQAIELRGEELRPARLQAIFHAVRETVAFVEQDRPLGIDVELLARRVAGGELLQRQESAGGSSGAVPRR